MVLEDTLIIGLVMAIVEVIKPYVPKNLLFVPILLLAVGLNIGAEFVWGDPLALRAAAKVGLELGALAAGVYGLGKAALGK